MQIAQTAHDAYVQYHMEIMDTLAAIGELVQDKPAPDFDGFEPNWRHVGDLNQIAGELAAIRARLEAGEV